MKGYTAQLRKLRGDLRYWQQQYRLQAWSLKNTRDKRRQIIRQICTLKRKAREGKP